MDNLRQRITENDTWTSAEGENDGTPFLLRFRPHLQDFIATNKYNKRLTILWNYNSEDSSLMPSNDEMDSMKDVEDILVDNLENDIQSVLAFVYTGQNQREWHWYSSDINVTGKRLNKALSGFDKLPIEISSEDDPDWSEYNAVLEGANDSEYEATKDD
jgi:hypothetical protein